MPDWIDTRLNEVVMKDKFLKSILSRGWKKCFDGSKISNRDQMHDFLYYAQALLEGE